MHHIDNGKKNYPTNQFILCTMPSRWRRYMCRTWAVFVWKEGLGNGNMSMWWTQEVWCGCVPPALDDACLDTHTLSNQASFKCIIELQYYWGLCNITTLILVTSHCGVKAVPAHSGCNTADENNFLKSRESFSWNTNISNLI